LPRLHTFLQPFGRRFHGQAAEQHATTYVWGLRANVERKNIASIATRCGPSRLPRQRGRGWEAWDDAPGREEWRRHVKMPLGPSDGVLVWAPSGLPKAGWASVGVARPGWGWRGTVDTCQVARSWGAVSRTGPPRGDAWLSLPKAGTPQQTRVDKAAGPQASRASRTRQPWALAMLEHHGARPAPSVAGR
jgi:hypothetical protein